MNRNDPNSIQLNEPNMKSPATVKQKKAAAIPSDGQTPVNITPDEGKKLRECAAKTGQTVAEFVRQILLEGIAKTEGANLNGIPCPFCRQTDCLETIAWTSERRNMTEYQGDAVKCHCCEAIAPATAWEKLGQRNGAEMKGGRA